MIEPAQAVKTQGSNFMRKWFLALLLFGAMGFGATANGWSGGPKSGGVIIYGRGADAVTLDPAKSDDLESAKVLENIFEGLVRYREDSTEIEPCLAVSWRSSKNETEWIFHLRKGVRFHDGTAFNANAVVFSLMRQIDSRHPYHFEGFKYAGFTFKYVRSVEPLDEHTVRISLDKPYAPFLYNLAMTSAAIVSPAAVMRWKGEFWKHPVGTGPFQFEKWIQNERVILHRNRDYWGKTAYLDTVVFKSILDNSDRLLELKTAAIHVMDGISPGNLNEILRSDEMVLKSNAGVNIGYLAMNTEKAPFDSLKVRQAVNHAIHKKNLVKFLYQDMAIPAKTPIPPTLWGYAEEVVDYEYDPEKARALLKEAGYGDGFSTTLWAMPVPRPYMPEPEKIARAIRSNLSAVGIQAEIVTHDWATYLEKVSNGEHDMCLLGWIGDNGDPDNFLYVLLDKENAVRPHAENVAFFRHDRLHDLLIQAQQTSNQAKRGKLYREAQAIIHVEAPWVPLVHAKQMVACSRSVKGLVQHPTGIIRFQRVWKE